MLARGGGRGRVREKSLLIVFLLRSTADDERLSTRLVLVLFKATRTKTDLCLALPSAMRKANAIQREDDAQGRAFSATKILTF